MKRYPKKEYRWRIETPHGDVTLIIGKTVWDTAGPVTIVDDGGRYKLSEYFIKHGYGMYGHAIELNDQYMIPQDVHHILLMNNTTYHRQDLITEYVMLSGFVPPKGWDEWNERNAGRMDDEDD